MNCAWLELLRRVPITGLRLSLCRRHLELCARCREASDSREALPPILVTADRAAAGLDLWPGVKRGIEGLHRPSASPAFALSPQRSWRWAYAVALLVLFLLAGFWALFLGHGMGPQPGPVGQRPAAQTRLCSARIADQPARVFQVQSRNPDRSIFWIAKDDKRS